MPGSILRPSDYGARLRLPATMAGEGGRGGGLQGNYMDLLYVRKLYVLQELEARDVDIDLSAASATLLGTRDPQDFRLKSNNVVRMQLLSAGAWAFVSAQVSSVIKGDSVTDAFNQADESPLAGWTNPAAGTTRSFYVLTTSAMASASVFGNNTNYLMYNDSVTFGTGDHDVQADLGVSGGAGRVGVAARIASGAADAYLAMVQAGVNDVQLWRLVGNGLTSLATFASSTYTNPATIRLLVSANGANQVLSCFHNGTFAGASEQSTTILSTGRTGIFFNPGGAASSWGPIDNWQTNVQRNPLSAADGIFQASAVLWTLLGQDTLTKWATLYQGSAFLGGESDIVMTGTKTFRVSAGASAVFPATTFGVTRLVSALGTAGLSGVVGFSATGALRPSAVANDLVWLDTGCFGISAIGSPVSGLSGVVGLSGVQLTVSSVANNVLISAAQATGAVDAETYAFFIGGH